MEYESAATDDYRVSRITAAVVPDYGIEFISVIIDNLALPFVPPLESNYAEIAHMPRVQR